MEHGRDHQNRQAHARPARSNNTPPDSGPPTARSNGGSDTGPTPRAQERERERHRLERELGRTPAGGQGLKRDHREPGVTREQLDEAARAADRAVESGE